MSRTVLVTVGTTQFDELIRAVDQQAFLQAIKQKGYKALAVQRGNGPYKPNLLKDGVVDGLTITCYDYKPNLANDIASADLVISHAGSGSIFEGLSSGRAMIVVPNARLMHNHQQELAQQLAEMRHLACATPDQLTAAVTALDASTLKPYVKGSAERIAQHITAGLGLSRAPELVTPAS